MVNRWGTDYGIRITKPIVDLFPVSDEQRLDVEITGDKIIFTRVREERGHKKLSDYLEEYGWDGEPCEPEKIDWGEAVGEEVEW
jgi:antitoxin component of MazEF toxin-antitoxin module